MKTVFLALIFFSNLAMAASLQFYHGRNFSPHSLMKCGWHVEVSNDFVVLDSIPNRFNPAQTQDCLGMSSLLFKCNGQSCTRMSDPGNEYVLDDNGTPKKEYVLFLNDGNMLYMNTDGESFKNYRH